MLRWVVLLRGNYLRMTGLLAGLRKEILLMNSTHRAVADAYAYGVWAPVAFSAME